MSTVIPTSIFLNNQQINALITDKILIKKKQLVGNFLQAFLWSP